MINERTRSGRVVTAKSGKYAGEIVLYGYTIDGGKFIESKAKLVRQMYTEGKSYGFIAKNILTLCKNSLGAILEALMPIKHGQGLRYATICEIQFTLVCHL